MNQVFIEDEVTELKKSTSELKEGIISIVAILNKYQKGRLYFGINDDGKVIGQDVSGKTLREVSEAIMSKIEPKIHPSVTNVKIDNKDCILVEFEGSDAPYIADGRAYIRVSDEDKQLSISEMRRILKKTTTEEWDTQVSDKTIDDVNEEVLKDYISRANEAKRISFEYTNKKDVLNRLGVLDESGKLLNAGKVLFCDDSKVELQMAVFATDTKTTFIDINKITGNLFYLINQGQDYIKKNILWNVKITDRREEYPEIPVDSIREAMVNSYEHKLFSVPKGTEISVFKNRVEIYNPGSFPEDYTPEDYIENRAHSIHRNPLIADLLYKSKESESYSSGIQRIHDECQENDVKVEFKTEPYGFTVIFYRKNDNINDIENTNLNEDSKNIKYDIEKILIKYPKLNEKKECIEVIEVIMEDNYITQNDIATKLEKTENSIYRDIKFLRENNIIERVGAHKNGYWKVNF